MGITVPFQKKWDMSQWGRERKGREWGREGEERCLDWISQDINHHLSTLQHEGRERTRERGKKKAERDTLQGIRQTGMKQPSIFRINVSAHHHPPPLCRHHHHSLRHYPCRCDACRGQAAKNGKNPAGAFGEYEDKMLCGVMEGCKGRIITMLRPVNRRGAKRTFDPRRWRVRSHEEREGEDGVDLHIRHVCTRLGKMSRGGGMGPRWRETRLEPKKLELGYI